MYHSIGTFSAIIFHIPGHPGEGGNWDPENKEAKKESLGPDLTCLVNTKISANSII